MVALALLAAPIALKLDVPRHVAPGTEVRIAASVTNVSKRPVTLIVAILPHIELGMNVARTIVGPAGAVETDERGPMMGQWFSQGTVGADSFLVLKPGETRRLYEEAFAKRFVGKRPSLLSEYPDAPRADLDPGDYTVRFTYRLDPKAPPAPRKPKVGSFFPFSKSVTPEAKRLFKECWRGEATAEATFRVTL